MTNQRRRRLTLALLISLLFHLAVVGMPGWRVPALDELLRSDAAPDLEARLAPVRLAPARTPPPVVKSTAAPHRPAADRIRANHAAAAVSGDTSPAAQPAPVEPPPVAEEAQAPSPPASAASPPVAQLPRRGSLRFLLSRGDGFVFGQAVYNWHHDGKDYALKSVWETTGIAAMLKPVRWGLHSEGYIGTDGLRPRLFRGDKGNKPVSAAFDWTAMTVQLSSGDQPDMKVVKLLNGAQDMLSVFFQFSAGYPWALHEISEVMIATGSKFERYPVKIVDEEKLATKYGEIRTSHLRMEGEGKEAHDIWVGLDVQGLPMKIRYTDRQGEVFDQKLDAVEYEGMPNSMKGH